MATPTPRPSPTNDVNPPPNPGGTTTPPPSGVIVPPIIVPPPTPPPTPDNVVHFVLLAAADRQDVAADQLTAIQRAAAHLQAWYRWQMGNGKTFVFDVLRFDRPYTSDWYKDNPAGGDHRWYFWNNVLSDLWTAAQGGFGTPHDDWVTYVDCEPHPDQGAGGTNGGGNNPSGVCVMGAHDLLSLQGRSSDWGQCRGIGGSGHEFGHTFGLPHPPPPPDRDWGALMGIGYGSYPNTWLTEANKAALNANPFFQVRPHLFAPSGLCPFDDGYVNPTRPRPTQRPRPVPTGRTRIK